MQKENVVLSSTAPITDGGKKYNILYPIGFVAGFVLGMVMKGIEGGIVLAVLGVLIMWGIKNLICKWKCWDFRNIKFVCAEKIPYELLIQRLQPQLMSLDMTIEMKKDGTPVISYKGLFYDVSYNENSTFSIYWRMSVIKALILGKIYTPTYKKASAAYGIIAYKIQQVCDSSIIDNQNTLQSKETEIQKKDVIICPDCGNACKTGDKFCMKCGSNLEVRKQSANTEI